MESEIGVTIESRKSVIEQYKAEHLQWRGQRFSLYNEQLSIEYEQEEAYQDESMLDQSDLHVQVQEKTPAAVVTTNQSLFSTNQGTNVGASAGTFTGSLLRDRVLQANEHAGQNVKKEDANSDVRTIASSFGGAVTLDMSNQNSFAVNPVPKGALVQCYIIRSSTGLFGSTIYECFFQSDDTFLLAAKKESGKGSTYYSFSTLSKKFDKQLDTTIGKLRANFLGTEFTLYDKGVNPTKDVTATTADIRKELSVIHYESNVLSSKGPRKMTVLLPLVRPDETCAIWKPTKAVEGLFANYKATIIEQICVLQNRMPKWNDQLAAYVLNFNGRVTMPSVKNFQLIDPEDPDRVLLQFGKTGKNNFSMDFSWPLTPMQAFAISISALDNKLACE